MIDIQAGDVVVCVDDSPCPVYGPLPVKQRAAYRVTDARTCKDINTGYEGLGLRLDRHNHLLGYYNANRFEKLDKATDKFTSQIKAIRPIREDA